MLRKAAIGVTVGLLLIVGLVFLIGFFQNRHKEREFSAQQLQTEEGCAYWTRETQNPQSRKDFNRRQGGNPSWDLTVTTHVSSKLGQCLILTESHTDMTDRAWHGLSVTLTAYSSELFGVYSKRDGEPTPDRCDVYPKGTRNKDSKDVVKCKSEQEFYTLAKGLME